LAAPGGEDSTQRPALGQQSARHRDDLGRHAAAG
jgi:hypothetical protein